MGAPHTKRYIQVKVLLLISIILIASEIAELLRTTVECSFHSVYQ